MWERNFAGIVFGFTGRVAGFAGGRRRVEVSWGADMVYPELVSLSEEITRGCHFCRYGINMSSCPFNKKARLVVYHLLPTAITQV